jgi:LmbE family N-acetylglucosaminyl deacetylase
MAARSRKSRWRPSLAESGWTRAFHLRHILRMTVVYILAHFDDEYCALPLVWEARREGLAQRFLYLADYRDPIIARRRLAETRKFLAAQGLNAEAVRPIGLGTGAFDGGVHRSCAELLPRVLAEVGEAGPLSRLVVPAWEGGHMDHDTCAWIGARIGERTGTPVRQFSLYNGPGSPGLLLRAATPLPQNGPVERLRLTPAEWLRWMLAVRAFPSQAYAWAGIWPAMAWGLARRGFGWQPLTPERVAERPHPGSLFYERMFKVSYAEVRAALDSQAAEVRPMTTRPTRIKARPAQ